MICTGGPSVGGTLQANIRIEDDGNRNALHPVGVTPLVGKSRQEIAIAQDTQQFGRDPAGEKNAAAGLRRQRPVTGGLAVDFDEQFQAGHCRLVSIGQAGLADGRRRLRVMKQWAVGGATLGQTAAEQVDQAGAG